MASKSLDLLRYFAWILLPLLIPNYVTYRIHYNAQQFVSDNEHRDRENDFRHGEQGRI